MSDSPSVASEILSYCTSCKMDLNHVVVAMKGDQVKKVECKTCNKTHVYRAPKGITTPPKKRTRKTRESSANTVNAEWEQLMASKKEVSSKPYKTKASFLLGDKVAHPSFGEGVVTKIIFPNKIEVIFQMDIKVMIHAGVPSDALSP